MIEKTTSVRKMHKFRTNVSEDLSFKVNPV